ncbi:hypothetical protein D3C80_1048040 [compost metagenome]
MADKKRKLTLQERIQWFAHNVKQVKWRDAITQFEQKGFTYDEAVVEALNAHNVPVHGKTIISGTVAVKTV